MSVGLRAQADASVPRSGERRRLAIVGSGIAGLATAYWLAPRHEVTVFEAADYVGGHTNTRDITWQGQRYAVDTGFIVYNARTYPLFCGLLDELGVATQESDMSFSVQCERTGLEYNGTSINSLFAQRRNLVRPSFWRMVREILRFNREAPALLEPGADADLTLDEFLARGRYGREFIEHYLIPMGAAIWSAEPERMRVFPAAYFVRFFHNHGFLTVDDRPTWRVIRGGSQRYVEKITTRFSDRIRLSSPVESVSRTPDGVRIKVRGRDPELFDGVVLACHSDQALRMLTDASDAERDVLGAIPYQENEAILHTDGRLLPKRRLAWASWNYHIPKVGQARVALTYSMNILQSLEAPAQFLVTLNRGDVVDPRQVIERIQYHHPVYTPSGVAAQKRHGEISGVRRTWYCGAYWSYGFHEDGVRSAQRVCRQLGVEV
ncbi:MAG: NAD(P)/FAD-dependent oxidoreductase [Planctomycetota bacterium]|jgi:predicted NAD/FAD-binding protein